MQCNKPYLVGDGVLDIPFGRVVIIVGDDGKFTAKGSGFFRSLKLYFD